jgi:hypothetical protein
MKTILASLLLVGAAVAQAAEPSQQPAITPSLPTWAENGSAVPNPQVDFDQYRKIAAEVGPVREKRRLTEEQFAAMAAEPGTVVLDARSANKFAMRHIRGAISLPFTEFTADTLARVIPAKDTRVLIYCNNNFTGAELEFPSKARRASLNISTYIALATYGYTNIYELGPLLDVKTTKLPFVGTEVGQESAQQRAQR